ALAKASDLDDQEATRDQLFELIMARFDAMNPHKDAVRSFVKSGRLDPEVLRTLAQSQIWMLEAAGVETDGLPGAVRVNGMISLYGSVVQAWLDDDDPGMAKTMAVLDRRLRRGERTMRNLDGVFTACEQVTNLLRPGNFNFNFRRNGKSADDAAGAADPGSGI
ncbi:MAG: hypothetical protein AAGG72_02995, partial [Pseudomonadota bacterium]